MARETNKPYATVYRPASVGMNLRENGYFRGRNAGAPKISVFTVSKFPQLHYGRIRSGVSAEQCGSSISSSGGSRILS